jgi:hypothetical protein
MRLKFLTTTDEDEDVYVDLHILEDEIKGFFVPNKFDDNDTICLFFCNDLITVQQSPELLHFLDKHIIKINKINTK